MIDRSRWSEWLGSQNGAHEVGHRGLTLGGQSVALHMRPSPEIPKMRGIIPENSQ
jgi:hypothetical protein